MDERNLLLHLQAGESRALDELMARYKQPLGRVMVRMLKSPEDTEEALQELFVRVWQHRAEIDPERPLRSYLFRIAQNLVLDMLRKSAREKRLIANYLTYVAEMYSHVHEDVVDAETRTILQEAIGALPVQRRRVFELCRVEGYSYAQVAEMLGISVATVNSHVTNANAFLREYFKNRPDLMAGLMAGLLVQYI